MLRFDKFTLEAQETIQSAQAIEKKMNNREINAEYVLIALLDQT